MAETTGNSGGGGSAEAAGILAEAGDHGTEASGQVKGERERIEREQMLCANDHQKLERVMHVFEAVELYSSIIRRILECRIDIETGDFWK